MTIASVWLGPIVLVGISIGAFGIVRTLPRKTLRSRTLGNGLLRVALVRLYPAMCMFTLVYRL